MGLDPLDPYSSGSVQTKTVTNTYTVLANGGIRTATAETGVLYGGTAVSRPSSERDTDMLGRQIVSRTPAFGGGWLVTSNAYDNYNRLCQSVVTCGSSNLSVTLYAYDDLGQQIRSALDLNGNGFIDLAGPDRATETRSWYEYGDPGLPGQVLGAGWWQVSASIVYPGDSSATPFTNSISRTRLSGFVAAPNGLLTAQTISADSLGNATVSSEYTDCVSHRTTRSTAYADSIQPAVTVSSSGRVFSQTSKSGVATTYGFDAFGRQILACTVGGPRSTATVTHYNTLGQIDYTQDAASNLTSFAYDPTTGFQTKMTDALSNITYTAYSGDGQVWRQWGSGTQPQERRYDPWGRQTLLATYRQDYGWSAAYWPTSPQGDITRWTYDATTGLLLNKHYADGIGPSYTYSPDGRLATRTWSRGVVTTYSQNSAGDLAGISYSDGTPGVAFTFNRLGQQKTITDATGTRGFMYNDAQQLAAETNAFGTLIRQYDTLGRPSGIALGGEYSARYGYDSFGRFASVSSSVYSASSLAKYSYVPGSDLVAGWSNSAGFAASRLYEPNRDLIMVVSNTWSGTPIGSFAYTNDALARRTGRMDNGSVTNVFGYNARSELTTAVMGINTNGYAYDLIGNRITASNNAEAFTYAVNALNQYTAITDGGTIAPLYDADGNLTNYNGWAYSWDGENRLIMAVNGATVVSNAYDYMSRRVAKVVNGGTRRLAYDGWNLIREAADAATNSYVWGLDFSGTLQGAGGIGGLLTASLNGANAFYFYDANGNVTDLVAPNGESVAHYEYDPYGNVTAQGGELANGNPFQFSTKYLDEETGLYYYGFRFYSLQLSRWVSRDLIEEDGGPNIYEFTENSAIAKIDPFGEATAAEDVAKLAQVAIEWQTNGWTFAANLLKAFYSRSGSYTPSASDIAEIRTSSEYRKAAKAFLSRMAEGFCDNKQSGKLTIASGKAGGPFAFDVRYGSGDLLYALGGAHFYFTGTMYLCCNKPIYWSAGVTMSQEDNYTFAPKGRFHYRMLFPSYRAARDLEFTYGYKPFVHTETWQDTFADP